MIPSQRHRFDIPTDVAYLNCAYMSPLMHSVQTAGARGIAAKARPWEVVADDFFTDSEAARKLFADMVGVSADDIAIVPAVSYGMATAAANLPVTPGRQIIILAEQFPSNVYQWRDTAARTGASLVTVARPEDYDWTRAVLAQLTPDTAIAALPHCHWTDGGLIDLEAVSARCREIGAALVLDLTQSAGALPIDLRTIRPAFAVSACYKWLMGPYSLGFLYVAPEYQECRPLEQNWIARHGSENFSRLIDYQDEYQRGARRFDMGERSNFQLMPMARTALEQVLAWGVDDIAETLAARNRTIAARARGMGLYVAPDHLRAGHYLGIGFPDGVPDGLAELLAAANVFVSVRGDSVRVTPHVYNDEHDIERFFTALEASI